MTCNCLQQSSGKAGLTDLENYCLASVIRLTDNCRLIVKQTNNLDKNYKFDKKNTLCPRTAVTIDRICVSLPISL